MPPILLNSLPEWPEKVARFCVRIYNRCTLSRANFKLLISMLRRFSFRFAVPLGALTLIAVASLTHPLTRLALTTDRPQPPVVLTEQQLDLLILHGKLVDGSGKKPRTADVGIRGDRIVFVADARKAHLDAARTIDPPGFVVDPGFIDPHTHTLGVLSDS